VVQKTLVHICAALFAAYSMFVAACEETPPNTTISQFDRPQDVALVCYDQEGKTTLPLGCCRTSSVPVAEECGVGLPTAKLYAFVTQTTPGEVAVVDLEELAIVDQDERIPYNSFIPVGGQPSDIAASYDGQKVYTANYETGDISVIDVIDSETGQSVIEHPFLEPSTSIYLGSPAGKLVIAALPESNRDEVAFVTLPTTGQLAVVALNDDAKTDDLADQHCQEPNPNGCLLGFLQLDDVNQGDDADNEGMRPWALVASKLTPSLYVGGSNGEFVVEVDGEILVEEAIKLAQPGPLSKNAIVRRIDTEGYTTRALALEPELERWMYAIENQEGGLLAIDLVQGKMIEVEEDTYSIDVPGRALALTMVRVGETSEPSPLTFKGTFAVVATTKAGIYVIDVDDENADTKYPHPHSLRSLFDLSEDSEYLPELVEYPQFIVNGDKLSDEKAREIAYFEHSDGGVEEDASAVDASLPECNEDAGVFFLPEWDNGFRFRCDPRESSPEDWLLTWQGSIGLSGTGVALFDHEASDDHHLVIRDEKRNFCEGGLNVGAYLPDDYRGDLFVVTSMPTLPPDVESDTECDVYEEKELVYMVEEVLDENTILISDSEPATPSLMLIERCFGQAFSYDIRAFRHWVLLGSESGHLYDGELSETDGGFECVTGPAEYEGRTQRVLPGTEFNNYYFAFNLIYPEDSVLSDGVVDDADMELIPDLKPEDDEYGAPILYFSFTTQGGFAPLSSIVGNDITDICFTPDSNLLLVDQAGRGLILFDMLGSFGVAGTPVN
jgi:hypothetical protein